MNNSSWPESISFHSIDPRTLSLLEMREVHEMIQDLWATSFGWLGELGKCKLPNCSYIFGKEEAFQREDISSQILYEKTSAEIMRILNQHDLYCPKCGSLSEIIYDENHLNELIDKMCYSPYSDMTVVKNKVGKVIWHASYYVGTLDDFYNNELYYHYSHYPISEIKERIREVLGSIPDNIIIFSAIGFLYNYRNPYHLFRLIQHALNIALEKSELRGYPGIMELDKTNPMYRIFMKTWGCDINGWSLVAKNTSASYDSRIALFNDPYTCFMPHFSHGPKHFLRST